MRSIFALMSSTLLIASPANAASDAGGGAAPKCHTDVECTDNLSCGGMICMRANGTSPGTCVAPGSLPFGEEGWCEADSDCKCQGAGATCTLEGGFPFPPPEKVHHCTFTKPLPPSECSTDVDCSGPSCGGKVCQMDNTVPIGKCVDAGTDPEGQDGLCQADSDCKCLENGATCAGFVVFLSADVRHCTFTQPRPGSECAYDVQCSDGASCGGQVCKWDDTELSGQCVAAGADPQGQDGHCRQDSDCKCMGSGATCNTILDLFHPETYLRCTSTLPPPADMAVTPDLAATSPDLATTRPDLAPAVDGSGTSGSSSGCQVNAGGSGDGAVLFGVLLLVLALVWTRRLAR